jgi:hypothetical protein
MIVIKKLFALFAFALLATGAHAGFSVFPNTDACEFAKVNGTAIGYVPTTKAPFKGGKGWTRRVVPAGGACLGGAYIMEDGVPVKGKSVYVAEGFVYWRHDASGAFRMHDCSNPFEELVLLGREEPIARPAPVPAPAPVVAAPAPCTTNCGPEVVKEQPKICEDRFGRQWPLPQNSECVWPEVATKTPIRKETVCGTCEPVVRTPPPVVQQQPKYVPSIQSQQQDCVGCHPEAKVLAEEPAPHGVCGIRAVDTNRRTVGLIQIDQFQGKIRFARVGEWRGRPTHRPVVTDLRSSPSRNCDEDQRAVEQHWAQVIKMLELPLNCTPQGAVRRQVQF